MLNNPLPFPSVLFRSPCMGLLLRWSLFLPLALILFTACYSPIEDDQKDGEGGSGSVSQSEGTLVVRVKSEEIIDTPVYLFAFDSQGAVAERATILPDGNLQASFQLPKGTFRIAAFAGTAGYVVPNSYSASSCFSLPNSNYADTPLLMGQADVILTSERQVLGLMLSSQVAQVEVSLDDVPEAATAVQISFGQQFTQISFWGEGSAPDRVLLPLSQSSLGRWHNPSPCYVLPGISTSTVMTLVLQFPDSTLSYAQTFNYGLRAGGIYRFTGHCGNLQSSTDTSVDKEEEIQWGSGDNNPQDTLPTIYVDALPEACSLVANAVVAAVEPVDASSCKAMLLSLNEWMDVASAYSAANPQEAARIAQYYQEYRLDAWRIPTREDASLLKQFYSVPNLDKLNLILVQAEGVPLQSLDSKDKAIRYLCNEAQHTFSFASGNITQAGGKTLYRLRLVKWVKFKRKS